MLVLFFAFAALSVKFYEVCWKEDEEKKSNIKTYGNILNLSTQENNFIVKTWKKFLWMFEIGIEIRDLIKYVKVCKRIYFNRGNH